jgi:hypothetical protein
MKTEQILEQVQSTNTISEQQINLLNRRLNAGEKIDLDYIWNNDIELTPEQSKKGIDFLRSQWLTPSGKERKNSPFGYREEDALKTFERFYFRGFYDASRYGQTAWYVPIYVVCGKETSFEYYYLNGKVEIIG